MKLLMIIISILLLSACGLSSQFFVGPTPSLPATYTPVPSPFTSPTLPESISADTPIPPAQTSPSATKTRTTRFPNIATAVQSNPVEVTPTPWANGLLEAILSDAGDMKILVDNCTDNYRIHNPYYSSGMGYVLPLYHGEQLCLTAVFTLQNGTWQKLRFITAAHQDDLQVSEIARTILNDPFLFPNLLDGCTQDFLIGKPVYVQFLDKPSGYYVQPFFNSKGLCYGVSLSFVNGKWDSWSAQLFNAGSSGNTYPQASGEDAKAYIEKMTCKKVFVAPFFADLTTFHGPFWKVTTADGETYLVVGSIGPTDTDPTPTLHMFAWYGKDDPREWLPPKDCVPGP